MLEAAGLAAPRLMTPLEQSEIGLGAGVLGWTAEGLVSFVISEDGEAGPAIVLNQLIATEGTACRGQFASGQQPAHAGSVVVAKRGFARCAETGGALTYFYSVVRRGQRNVVFGFIATEDNADRAAATSAEIERLMLRLNR